MTAPYYGKRRLGAGTAVSPGDTLHFQFGTYNDSGDSEILSTTSSFAVTDIEVIKNGLPTVRATDSGYSLISDTGMVGDRAGLYRCSIQLYNTADDAAFYANGAWYQAFVDSITVDGKTVRLWLGSWEIGDPIQELDTGLRDTLADYDTGIRALFALVDTGKIATAVWAGDTGLRDLATKLKIELDTGLRDTLADYDTGIRAILFLQDTGKVATAVWAGDTGVRDLVTKLKIEIDTGLRDTLADYDTGIRFLLALQDTGKVATAVWAGDTGLRDLIGDVKVELDTGLRGVLSGISAKTGSLTFTVAGQVDANVQYVNDTQVIGTGDTGTGNTWRPA